MQVLLLIPQLFLTNIRDLAGLGLFSLLADCANILAYSVVFWFDFEEIEESGPRGKALSISGVPFALGVAIYCYEGAGLIISLESSVPVTPTQLPAPPIPSHTGVSVNCRGCLRACFF